MRTTIYIPDELVDEVKEEAWRVKRSVSDYLMELHRLNMRKGKPIIELKNGLTIEFIKSSEPKHEGWNDEKTPSDTQEEVQEGIQEKTIAEQLKEGANPIIVKPIRSYSKAKQLGKKGGKK